MLLGVWVTNSYTQGNSYFLKNPCSNDRGTDLISSCITTVSVVFFCNIRENQSSRVSFSVDLNLQRSSSRMLITKWLYWRREDCNVWRSFFIIGMIMHWLLNLEVEQFICSEATESSAEDQQKDGPWLEVCGIVSLYSTLIRYLWSKVKYRKHCLNCKFIVKSLCVSVGNWKMV